MAKKQNNYISTENTQLEKIIIPLDIKGDKKFYLYVHYRKDKNEPFYVGIGTRYREFDHDRAICFKKRNNFWKRVHRKTSYTVMIIAESDDKQEIINKEINYIRLLGKRKDKKGSLVNLTDGGEGLLGHKVIWTEEMKNKIREANKNRIIKDSTREKLRIALKKRGIINKKDGKERKSSIN